MKDFKESDLENKLKEYDWDKYYWLKDPEECWKFIYDTLVEIFDELCPEKEMTNVKNKTEWLNANLFEIMRVWDHKVKIAIKSREPDNLTQAKIYRNMVNDTCLKAKNEMYKPN